jgi:cation diffusion facilitator CzcD-associated flavoprotein CzcO
VARVLIVGGGCRGRALARELVGEGHAVRITTRPEGAGLEQRRAAIGATGAECLSATPARLGTLRGALEHVTIACWLLGTATGPPEEVRALHGARLEAFLAHAVDSTLRGFVYETGAAKTAPAQAVAEGERIVREASARNAIPVAFVRADPGDLDAWLGDARAAIDLKLAGDRTDAF